MIDGERIKEETLKEKQYIKELVEMNFPMGFLEYMTQRPEEEMILSILVDTFISKISFPMQPGPEIGSISDA